MPATAPRRETTATLGVQLSSSEASANCGDSATSRFGISRFTSASSRAMSGADVSTVLVYSDWRMVTGPPGTTANMKPPTKEGPEGKEFWDYRRIIGVSAWDAAIKAQERTKKSERVHS